MSIYTRHRQVGNITKNTSLITWYKGETYGAKGEQCKTPVDSRRLKEGGCAPQHNMTP